MNSTNHEVPHCKAFPLPILIPFSLNIHLRN